MSLPPRGPVHLVTTRNERQCEKFELRPLTAAVVRASAFYKASLQVERRKKASCLSSAGRSRKAKRSASEKYRSAISLIQSPANLLDRESEPCPHARNLAMRVQRVAMQRTSLHCIVGQSAGKAASWGSVRPTFYSATAAVHDLKFGLLVRYLR